jgi:glycosyltransferase involved in cell wall biosynthesis
VTESNKTAGPSVRVARIITRLNIGGPAIQAIDLSRGLQAEGFETCLMHGHLGEGEGDMLQLLPLDHAHTVYIDNLVRPVSPLRDVRALWAIYRSLRTWRPTIVHTHMAKAGSLGRIAALAYNRTTRHQRTYLVHTYHGHVFDGYFASASTKIFLAIERWLARHTDVLVAISAQLKIDLLQTYRVGRDEQVRVIPLGFNLDRLLAIDTARMKTARAALDIPASAVVVSTVGRLTAIKQQSLFLDMAAALALRSDRFVFLVVGDGELRRDLQARAKILGIESRVRFLGWRGDLETIYGATDIFVLTSRNEGTPVALIEAMAAGVASVSTDVGGVRDVITGPGLGRVVPFGQPAALADAVEALAADSDARAAIAAQARTSVQRRFHAKRLIEDITGLYCELLANRGTISHETT